jgi:TldD protein
MRDRLADALNAATADYADIRVETEESSWVGYRGPEVESAGTSAFRGGIARACTRGGWGMVTFDSPDGLRHAVEEACACARWVGRETTQLADVRPVDAERRAVLGRDFRGVSLDDKRALMERYNRLVLDAAPSIESSRVSYRDSFRTVRFASTRGAWFLEERPRVLCVVAAVARDGALVQRAHHSVASATTYDTVAGLDDDARATAARADALLRAPKCEGGPHTVILNPDMAGVFVHEAFGHLSEGDFLYENEKMRALMHPGRVVGTPALNVVDDGSLPGRVGSQAFDDEGTPTGKTYLVRRGALAGYLHSLETAGKMGAAPTGNARAIARDVPPIVRMTNTYIEGGDVPVDDLFAGVERGIYACDSFGGQTALEMFTFSAAYGYRIENGKKGELVRDVTLTGNVFETLKSIDGIGDDFVICERAGGCGKGSQSPLPVTCGAPHVRIRDVVIGGG